MTRAERRISVFAALVLAGVLATLAQGQGTTPTTTTTAVTAPPTCTAQAAGNHEITVESGRVPVLVHVPPGTTPTRRPLIVVLPGAGQDGHTIAQYTGYSRLADAKGFLVAYPTATGTRPFWNVSGTDAGRPDDVAYLRKVITTLSGPAACADPERIGVTGVSNGGGMTARLACDAADLLAAAAPVAGGYSTLPDCHPEKPLPLLEIHGLRDTVVPYGGKGPTHAGAVGPFLDGWLDRDGCTRRSASSNPAPNVQELRWQCAGGRVVVHDRVADAEHGWPGEASLRQFSSTLRTWRFLQSFSR